MKDSFEVINVQDGRLYDKDLNPRKLNKRTKALKNEFRASIDIKVNLDLIAVYFLLLLKKVSNFLPVLKPNFLAN